MVGWGDSDGFLHRERVEEFRPAIYVSNHASTLDAFVAIWILPDRWLRRRQKRDPADSLFGWLYFCRGI